MSLWSLGFAALGFPNDSINPLELRVSPNPKPQTNKFKGSGFRVVLSRFVALALGTQIPHVRAMFRG